MPRALTFVAGQWTYDAYGEVVSAHPFMHAGHKGLFFDRLDVGVAESGTPGMDEVETPRLVPFAAVIYCNRNRSYHPRFGRFLQMDPNASGLITADAESFHGSTIKASPIEFSIAKRLNDGPCLYEYLGSNPSTRIDPAGLYIVGDIVLGMTSRMIEQYASNQDFDVEWATDWSYGDQDHSRVDNWWLAFSQMLGLAEAVGVDPFDGVMPDGPSIASRTGAGVSKRDRNLGSRALGLSPSQLHRLRSDALGVAGTPATKRSGAHGLTKAGRSLLDHPELVEGGQNAPKTTKSDYAHKRFGSIQAINDAGMRLARRFVKLGVPVKTRDGVKFMLKIPAGHSNTKNSAGLVVKLHPDGSVKHIHFWGDEP